MRLARVSGSFLGVIAGHACEREGWFVLGLVLGLGRKGAMADLNTPASTEDLDIESPLIDDDEKSEHQ